MEFYFIAIWAIVLGIFKILADIKIQKEIKDEWFLILFGIFLLFVGMFLFVNPLTVMIVLV
ncbi:MAG: hypothetical protein GXZ15_05155 [Campylobacter sp.]|nr:hypothetical protein [Campylobacter sp.]